MSTSESRKVEGWRAKQRREHDELLGAVLKRDGAFVLLDEGQAIDQVQGERVITVGRKGRKHLYLRNETGVQDLKAAGVQRRAAYKAEWIRRKRAANPGFDREAKRRYRASRTPEQVAHDRLVSQIYQQLLVLAGLAPWQRKSKSRAPDLCFVWGAPLNHHLGEAE